MLRQLRNGCRQSSKLEPLSSGSDEQYDPSRHINDDGFCCCEISRTPSDTSDPSDPQAVGDLSRSLSQSFEEATRTRHALHQAYPDLFQQRLAILKGLCHESIPTFR